MIKYHKRFSKEFKEEPVRLLLTGGKTAGGLGRELGVSGSSLTQWKKEVLQNGDHPEMVKPKSRRVNYAVLEQENLRLKQELPPVICRWAHLGAVPHGERCGSSVSLRRANGRRPIGSGIFVRTFKRP